MDLEEYKQLADDKLMTTIRGFSRSVMEEQFQMLGGQYALLCQRLEAIYTGDRTERFISIRPGGLQEIDHALRMAKQEHQQEITLLNAYRDLNRVLLPFMDVYEEHVLGDLKHMSRDELENLHATVTEQIKTSLEVLEKQPGDYRLEQNSSGKVRLASIFKEAIGRELTERFGVNIDER